MSSLSRMTTNWRTVRRRFEPWNTQQRPGLMSAQGHRIVFLYSELAGYFLACAEALGQHPEVASGHRALAHSS